jgi:hypothetical protein
MTVEEDPELAAAATTPIAIPEPEAVQPAKVLAKPEPIKSEPVAEVKPAATEVAAPAPVVKPAAPAPVVKPAAPAVPSTPEIERIPASAPGAFEEPSSDIYWLGGNAERIKKTLSNKIPQEKVK